MFDFSFSEILIIAVVAVIVLDPRHLPEVARSAGRWMGRARRFVNKMREDLDDQIGTEHLGPLRELNDEWQRTKSMLGEKLVSSEREGALSADDDAIHPDFTPSQSLSVSSQSGERRASSARPAPRRRRGGRGRRTRSSSVQRHQPPVRKQDGGEGV